MNKEIETEDHARASCGRWAVTSSSFLLFLISPKKKKVKIEVNKSFIDQRIYLTEIRQADTKDLTSSSKVLRVLGPNLTDASSIQDSIKSSSWKLIWKRDYRRMDSC